MTDAFPLQWPQNRPRTASRKRAAFGKKVRQSGQSYDTHEQLTVADALFRLQDEIDRLGARQYVLSTNLEPRLDGLPRSSQREPADPGVALYFHLNGKPHCLPCDTYDRVADNIAAIAKHIEATRAIERYGVANLAEMFAGFTALPAPGAKRPWREILGLPPRPDWKGSGPANDREQIETAYRIKAKRCHPDAPGGSHDAMAELNRAREDALREVGG